MAKQTFSSRVEEFNRSERASYTEKPATPPTGETTPYLRARVQVLMRYPEWRRNEVLEMERVNDLDNRHYGDFVKEVVALGDSFMP